MMNNKKIFWICSYPKSGNTWLRLILCALFFTNDGNLNNFNLLELLKKIPNFDQLVFFKFIKKLSKKDYEKVFNISEYTDESIITYSKYWIEAQKRISVQGDFGLFKTHNARIKVNNNYFTNSSTTRGFIYIARDPRDIVVSRSAYQNIDIDRVVNSITDSQLTSRNKTGDQMPEMTLNWGDHYLSWKTFAEVPSLFIRYEDLLKDIEFEIKKILNFFKKNFNIKIKNEKLKIKKAIESTNFQKLKEKEAKEGFYKSYSSFFREGKSKQWLKELNQHQKNILEKKFNKQLNELEYL